MKKSCLSFLALSLFVAATTSSSFACSIEEGKPEIVKDEIIPRLATALKVSASAIKRENLTVPGISYIAGLGNDCSGIEYAVRTTAYNFTTSTLLKKCTYKGVVVIKGIGATHGEFFLNNEPVSCTSNFRPGIGLPRINL